MNLIELEKGDVLVVKTSTDVALSPNAITQIKETLAGMMPGVTIAVLDGGLSVDVLRKSDVCETCNGTKLVPYQFPSGAGRLSCPDCDTL